MECPKCHFDHALQTTECLRCGVIFSKYVAAVTAPVPVFEEPTVSDEELLARRQEAKRELMFRVFALPGALLVGWLVVQAAPMLADFLRMWTHETGHAIAAWLSGFPALPTAWMTLHSGERQPVASLLLAAGLIFGGYVARRRERWFWVVVLAGILVLLVAGNLRSTFQAQALITFGGDAGSFVVSTLLMATFYAR